MKNRIPKEKKKIPKISKYKTEIEMASIWLVVVSWLFCIWLLEICKDGLQLR